jgi:hypothetical protein
MLAARDFKSGPSKLMVDYVSRFIHDSFGHSVNAGDGLETRGKPGASPSPSPLDPSSPS